MVDTGIPNEASGPDMDFVTLERNHVSETKALNPKTEHHKMDIDRREDAVTGPANRFIPTQDTR